MRPDQLNLILAIVSLVVGAVAFVATVAGVVLSVFFYREGSNLQREAGLALAEIRERTYLINSHVGGWLDRAWDHFITSQSTINEGLDRLSGRLESLSTDWVESLAGVSGKVGEGELREVREAAARKVEQAKDDVKVVKRAVNEAYSEMTREEIKALFPILLALVRTEGALSAEQLHARIVARSRRRLQPDLPLQAFHRCLGFLMEMGDVTFHEGLVSLSPQGRERAALLVGGKSGGETAHG